MPERIQTYTPIGGQNFDSHYQDLIDGQSTGFVSAGFDSKHPQREDNLAHLPESKAVTPIDPEVLEAILVATAPVETPVIPEVSTQPEVKSGPKHRAERTTLLSRFAIKRGGSK